MATAAMARTAGPPPRRLKSSTASAAADDGDMYPPPRLPGGGPTHPHMRAHAAEVGRLSSLRNVGVLAHVDAGKTTVTERMLALAGVVGRAGAVDAGSTVTDYLPAERERGITIQSAAIGFDWGWHNASSSGGSSGGGNVTVHLIDTPGHVDFSVEVNRSVAVLDGAVLVVDAVAGVQAQTETVWRAINRSGLGGGTVDNQHGHEPLPCLALVNKMDKDGRNFGLAVRSLRRKLPGANPVPIQIPVFRVGRANDARDASGASAGSGSGSGIAPPALLPPDLHAVAPGDLSSPLEEGGDFVGVVDLVHMRAVLWPDVGGTATGAVANVDDCVPTVTSLLHGATGARIDPDCAVTDAAARCRADLVGQLADAGDEAMEECFLLEEDPCDTDLLEALRRATLARDVLPVLAGAALRGKGVEPLLDAIADLLPSPLDRAPPALNRMGEGEGGRRGGGRIRSRSGGRGENAKPGDVRVGGGIGGEGDDGAIGLGHPLHSRTLALAFKVVHMKGRGGSGDGRVVFARVYSGKIRARDTVRVITPPLPGGLPDPPRTERVGSLLELAGGRFDNLEEGSCMSGDVCALVGLKSVVTGDTLLLVSADENGGQKGKGRKKGGGGNDDYSNVFLAGVASPKPVLTVRVEAESSEQQAKLSNALKLLSVEDPSLEVEESDSATLISGLGELHIEVVLDRLRREHGLEVSIGAPAVAYRETVTRMIETDGLVEYDRTIGGTRLQASVHLSIEPVDRTDHAELAQGSSSMLLSDPFVTIGPRARKMLGVDEDCAEEELVHRSELVKSLISGCLGSLKRGTIGPHPMTNVCCHVIDIDADGGLPALAAMPGSIRAATANAVTSLLADEGSNSAAVLEPTMRVEVTIPSEMVGAVLSDLTSRRGNVGDVIMGSDEDAAGRHASTGHAKALVTSEVPLIEILGYANSLRSLTGGEGNFTAEYMGHRVR